MPRPAARRLLLPLLAMLAGGACQCFEQKRTGPLPRPVALEDAPPDAPRSRYVPTPLDPSPPPEPEAVPVAAPTNPPSGETPTVDTPPQPGETRIGEAAHAPRVERISQLPLDRHKAIESLRHLSPTQRTKALRGSLIQPERLKSMKAAKSRADGPEPEPVPEPVPAE